MSKAVSLGLLAGGILFLILSINASNALSSDVARFFTGSPTDSAMWMLVGGVVTPVLGLVGLMRTIKRS